MDSVGLLHARDGRAMESFQAGINTVYNVYKEIGVSAKMGVQEVPSAARRYSSEEDQQAGR